MKSLIFAILFACLIISVAVYGIAQTSQQALTDDQLRLFIANATIELQNRQIAALSKENTELKAQLAAK